MLPIAGSDILSRIIIKFTFTTGLIKQIQKAIADAVATGMEYVNRQVVSVCDGMASAKANEGENDLQDVYLGFLPMLM